MPNYIWDLTGFCCGFLLCWLMSGVSDNGSVAPRPGDAVKAALDAWGKRVLTRLAGPGADPRASVKDTSSGRQLSLVALVGIVVLFLAIDDGQRRGLGAAYNIEAWLAGSRSAAFLFFLIAGWAVSRFRRDLGRIITRILSSFRDEKGRFSTISQSVFIAVAGLIAFNIIDPGLFRRVTSFKAYEIEAKFGDNKGTIQHEGSNIRDFHRAENLLDWRDFSYLDFGKRNEENEFAPYVPPPIADDFLHDGVPYNSENDLRNWRSALYQYAKAPPQRAAAGQILFSNYIRPLTFLMTCLSAHHQLFVVQRDPVLIELTNNLIQLVRNNQVDPDRIENILGEFRTVFKRFLNYYSDSVRKNPESGWAGTFISNNDYCKYNDLKKISDISDDDMIGRDVGAIVVYGSGMDKYLWDIYLVAFIGDLLAISQGQDEKAQFLSSIRSLYFSGYDMDGSALPLTGFLNFNYQLADAKMRSTLAWPLDDAVDDMDKNISATQRTIQFFKDQYSKEDFRPQTKDGRTPKNTFNKEIINVYFSLLVQNTARGLEIYYRRALEGEYLTKQHIDHWQKWLHESEKYMSVLENIGDVVETSPDEKYDLLGAESSIPPSAIEDLAIGSALSLVLIPGIDETVSSQNCLRARSYMNFARKEGRLNLYADEDDRPTLKGLLEFLANKVDSACRR